AEGIRRTYFNEELFRRRRVISFINRYGIASAECPDKPEIPGLGKRAGYCAGSAIYTNPLHRVRFRLPENCVAPGCGWRGAGLTAQTARICPGWQIQVLGTNGPAYVTALW